MKKIVSELLSIPPRQAERIALRALTVSAIVAVLLSLSKLCIGCAIKADHKRAVQNYTENNNTTITQNADGSTTVQGYSNGEPFGYIENNTFCDGITLDGIAISGNTFDEVRKDYYERFNQFKSSVYYSVNSGDSGYIIDASALDLTSNVDEVLLEAMRVGRESDTDFLANYNRRLEVSKNGLEFTTTVSYNEEALQEFIDNIAGELDIAPVEPYITMRNLVGGGKPGVGIGGSSADVYATDYIKVAGVNVAEVIFHNGSVGASIDRNALKESILEAYSNEIYNKRIELVFTEELPTGDVEALKANFKLITSFNTSFSTSGTNRSRNVQKAAGMLHCVEIVPGEEQTYNGILGPRTEAGGWLQAAGISGGKEYVDSPGGGICQVSTTLYNALLMVGPDIEITQRHHHSIPGSYIDLGLDATVSTYGPDLGWQNNSEHSYFIVSYADMNSKKVYCSIYGIPNPDGFTYKLRSELISEEPPPDSIMVPEPLWPTGYSQVTITPRNRYVVNVYRQKYDSAGQPVGEEEYLYQDIYKSVQGEIHYGTGSSSLPKPN